MPDDLKSIPPRVFLLGLLWAVAMSLGPVAGILVYWAANWKDSEVEWGALASVAGPAAAAAVIGYWRKYKAQIALPPVWAEARELAMGVKTVTTTAKTVERTDEDTVTTTVKETKVVTPVAPPAPREGA
jgi:hypothetical protein